MGFNLRDPVILSAGEDPPRLIGFGEPGTGTCACCEKIRDVTALSTYDPARWPETLGTVTVCGKCIAAALAVRFAAHGAAADPGATMDTPDAGEQP